VLCDYQVFLDAKRRDDTQMESSLQLDLSCPDSLFEIITSKVNIRSLSLPFVTLVPIIDLKNVPEKNKTR